MTKKEAIINIGTLRTVTKDILKYSGTAIDKAVDMAIKALELEQQPCDDAVSRQAVMETMCIKHCITYPYCKSKYGCIKMSDIKDLPSVQPQPKIGYWIVQPSNKEQGERPFIWWKCSNCGQIIFSTNTHDRLKFHAFCGKCGAKMIEPSENEDKDGLDI